MAKHVRYHPHVSSDVRNAIAWYDDISSGLGERFREEADDRLTQIETAPDSFARAFEDYHFARLPSFPYIWLMRAVGNVTYIVGLMHESSDPELWRDRGEDFLDTGSEPRK